MYQQVSLVQRWMCMSSLRAKYFKSWCWCSDIPLRCMASLEAHFFPVRWRQSSSFQLLQVFPVCRSIRASASTEARSKLLELFRYLTNNVTLGFLAEKNFHNRCSFPHVVLQQMSLVIYSICQTQPFILQYV